MDKESVSLFGWNIGAGLGELAQRLIQFYRIILEEGAQDQKMLLDVGGLSAGAGFVEKLLGQGSQKAAILTRKEGGKTLDQFRRDSPQANKPRTSEALVGGQR